MEVDIRCCSTAPMQMPMAQATMRLVRGKIEKLVLEVPEGVGMAMAVMFFCL